MRNEGKGAMECVSRTQAVYRISAMFARHVNAVAAACFAAVVLVGCGGGGGGGGGGSQHDGGNNTAPVVLINGSSSPPVMVVDEGQCFNLDGTGSYDSSGFISSFRWTQSGAYIALFDETDPYLPACAPADLNSDAVSTLTLTATDNDGAISSVSQQIQILNTDGSGGISNSPPVASINGDSSPARRFVDEGECIDIDMSGTRDPDEGDSITSVTWSASSNRITLGTPTFPGTRACMSQVDGNAEETITLTIADSSGAQDFAVLPVTIVDVTAVRDGNDSRATATLIGSDGSYSGSITQGDVDYYRFSVPTSGTVQINSTGDIDLYGVLEAENGAEIAYDDDNGEGTNFSITQQISEGTHYIRVTGFSPNVYGSYMLHTDFSPSPGGGASSSIRWGLTDNCNDGQDVLVKFYDRANNLVWPDRNEVYVLSVPGRQYIHNLACVPGASICYGAEPRDRRGAYWGVSLDGDSGCVDCCGTCGEEGTYRKSLTCAQ